MRHIMTAVIITGLVASNVVAAAPDPDDVPPTVGSIERLDPRLDTLVAPGATIEVLASGFAWSEGPVWVRAGGWQPEACLLFSDIPRNRINRWRPGHGIDVFMEPSGYTGVAEYGTEPGCNGLTLADRWEGKRLNSPNDVVVHSSGAIYFTDPPYGLPDRYDDPRRELDFCGVYRISVDGRLDLLCRTMTRPNGLAFSPDEKTLYVAQSDPEAPIWRAFAVKPDGTLDGDGRVFFDGSRLFKTRKGLPDGLKVDAAGHLFATGPGGVLVFTPDGTHLGTILTGQKTANCAFGEDGRTLYMTADSLLCRVKLATQGALPGR